MGHGTESDIHTLQFEGNHFSYHALHRSAYPLFPGSLATLHMLADNNGSAHSILANEITNEILDCLHMIKSLKWGSLAMY